MRRVLPAGYELDDDPSRLDGDAIAAFLTTEAYWSTWRTRDDIDRQLRDSYLCIGAYAAHGVQVGFARVVSDGVSFAYLADVYLLASHRGQGLGRALVAFTIDHGPQWRWILHTRDAGPLYAQYGFGPPPANLMERPGSTQ